MIHTKYIGLPAILLLMLICITEAQGQWKQVQSGATTKLTDVFFPTATTGYAVGEAGTVLRSEDGGNTWIKVYTDSLLSFRSVYFTNANTGFAAGGTVTASEGVVYKTTDGGQHWTVSLSGSRFFERVYFINASVGFAGTLHKVFRTNDGGSNWTEVISSGTGRFSSIYFPNSFTGYFIGGQDFSGELFKTTDGGKTFDKIANGYQSIKEAVHFINDSVGYMIGWYSPLLAKTTNGGKSWQMLDTIHWPGGVDVYFVNEQTGYFISLNGEISKTIDGGKSWELQLKPYASLNEFFFIDDATAVAVGDGGAIYKMGKVSTGIDAFPKKEGRVSVYPMPAKQQLTIEIKDRSLSIREITLTDQSGKRIRHLRAMQKDATHFYINISSLKPGMYFIHMLTAEGVIVEKMVVE